ncbi:MAG TPA: hypothetical protein VK742_20660 [Candidatus Sulfotelmatobacter sp.]|jgi:hypothetical protein|nr:hypothetical protein [Candidatus Sulfotelmatobacter sp.]
MTQKKISVICAPPPSPNPGMLTVDLAFHDLWQESFPQHQVRFWHLLSEAERKAGWKPRNIEEKIAREASPVQYECLRRNVDEAFAASAVIYWGDFFHMAHYREQSARWLVSVDKNLSPADALKVVDQCYFLDGAGSGLFARTLAYGGNLLFNRASDYLDAGYGPLVQKFLLQTRRVWMRDVFSAGQVNRLRNEWTTSHAGTDCALLMTGRALAAIRRNNPAPPAGGRAAVFFHRNQGGRGPALKFARALCRHRKVRPFWLPWRVCRPPGKWQRLVFSELEFPLENHPPTAGDLLDHIAASEFVITDTYHICVNAWRLGVPAICIGETWTRAGLDVSSGHAEAGRDKRWVFYSTNEALEFYIHAGQLSGSLTHMVGRMTRQLENRALISFITDGMRARADAVKIDFLNCLQSLF